MRRHQIASQILLILSIFSTVLAAPVAAQGINELRVNAVDAAKDRMALSEKRMMDSDTDSDPGDQWSTNVEQPADESAASWRTANSRFSSDRTASGSEASSEFDTATSRLSTGSHPGSIDDPPENPQPAPDHPPPLGPESPPSTFYTPPSSPQPSIDNTNPQLALDDSHPPPSNPAPSTGPHQPTDNHPPPDMEPQHPGTSVFGSFLNKLMKGKFKRHISVYGYENLAQRELQGTVGPGSHGS